jgi:hypothetical protein
MSIHGTFRGDICHSKYFLNESDVKIKLKIKMSLEIYAYTSSKRNEC